MFSRRFGIFIACISLFCFLRTPVVLAAAGPLCDCYCSTSEGAAKLSDKMTADACASACKGNGKSVAACAVTAADAPDRSPYCFTQQQCTDQKGLWDKKQTWDCVSGQRYCFPDPAYAEKARLNVAIGSYKVSGNLGEYVGIVFSFLLGAGVLIAIVMVMIGGLQYAIGAASPGQISAAKKRMTDAVTGLLLLACVYLIAQTVNPYLLKLEPPQFPMIKPITLANAGSCEAYAAKTDEFGKSLYQLDNIPTGDVLCGQSANVSAAPGQPAIAAGTSCDYKTCPSGQGCLGTGKNAKCVKCTDVTKDNSFGVQASSSVCGQLSPPPSVTKGASIIRCGYSEDGDLVTGVSGTLGGAAVTGGVCAQMTLNCASITKCEDYDKVQVQSGSITTNLEQIQNTVNFGDFSLKSVCEENPCGLHFPAAAGNFEAKCKYDTLVTPGVDDCVASSSVEVGGVKYFPGNVD